MGVRSERGKCAASGLFTFIRLKHYEIRLPLIYRKGIKDDSKTKSNAPGC